MMCNSTDRHSGHGTHVHHTPSNSAVPCLLPRRATSRDLGPTEWATSWCIYPAQPPCNHPLPSSPHRNRNHGAPIVLTCSPGILEHLPLHPSPCLNPQPLPTFP